MQVKRKNKDLSVELLRIIGALLVIGTHSKQGFFVGESLSEVRVLIACLVGDGVAVFWLIAGFFFPGDSLPPGFYLKNLKKSVKRILLPMFSLIFVTFFFSGWLLDGQTLSESVHHSTEEYIQLSKGFLQWRCPVDLAGHMWYMFVYFLLMLSFPAVWGLVRWGRSSSKNYVILVALWLLLLLNDCFHNGIFRFSHYSINGLAGAIVYVLAGSILYQWRDKFIGNVKTIVLGCAMIIGSNLIRNHFQCNFFLANPDDSLFLFWYTNFAFINVIGIVILVWSMIEILKKSVILENVIYHIGGKTMMIYLVHYLVLQKTRNLGWPKLFKETLGTGLKGSIIYQISYTLMIFIFALIVAEVIGFIWKLILRIIRNNNTEYKLNR